MDAMIPPEQSVVWKARPACGPEMHVQSSDGAPVVPSHVEARAGHWTPHEMGAAPPSAPDGGGAKLNEQVSGSQVTHRVNARRSGLHDSSIAGVQPCSMQVQA